MIAIYHRIYKRENFETAAKDLIKLIYMTQVKNPDEPRALFVDIEGHKNEAGGFDEDMQELQTEFGLGVLLQFVEELHFPLISVKNAKGQQNDVPSRLMIGNQRNEKDSSLEELYIENYSNTEFLSEPDIYQYLQHLSIFLQEYAEWVLLEEDTETFDSFGWLRMWHKHVNELSIELFNSFIHGNLLSVAAMTRSLIECYIFIKILKREKSQELIDEWCICNWIHKAKQYNGNDDSLKDLLKSFCLLRGICFEEKWTYYNSKDGRNDKAWLNNLMGNNGTGTRALCKYIGEEQIYKDYQ